MQQLRGGAARRVAVPWSIWQLQYTEIILIIAWVYRVECEAAEIPTT
jgi:hypothetical protein